jgi:hypothetical protein
MKSDAHRTDRRLGKADADHRVRPSIRIAVVLAAGLCALALIAPLRSARAPRSATEPASALPPATEESASLPDGAPQRVQDKESANDIASTPLSAPAHPAPPAFHPEPTPETRQLVSTLVSLELTNGVLTDQRAAAWKQNLRQLVEYGPAAVPAIQEFLATKLDVALGDDGRQMLGYSSVRASMFDALAQIAGPEAVAALSGTLQTTAAPMEIALLAQDLDKLEPQQHQEEALNAARQALGAAGSHKLETADVAPLFEVLQKYGGAGVVPELEKATGQWNYYGTIALAQLSDGAGIPSLVQIAQDPKAESTTRDAALQMLAQVADQSPKARAALVGQARLNAISEFAWRLLAPVLGGDQVGFRNSAFEHPQGLPQVGGQRTTLTSDNQNFYASPASLTPEQTAQRVTLMDELLSATSNPTAQEVLQEWKSPLMLRLSQLSAAAAN